MRNLQSSRSLNVYSPFHWQFLQAGGCCLNHNKYGYTYWCDTVSNISHQIIVTPKELNNNLDLLWSCVVSIKS